MNEDILVSISCITYNHDKYIRDCFDGFLMQKTDFAFEVLVHDDASTDNTSNIIREYQEKYPDIFKPIIQKENQYSKGIRSFSVTFNFPRAKGKYIALCEGDDYWTDPYKLQKQLDFMEQHDDVSMCFHRVNVIIDGDIGNSRMKKNIYDHLTEKEYTGQEVYSKWTIPTASTFFRNYGSYFFDYSDSRFIFGDTVLFLRLAEKGKLFCLNDIMATYRRSIKGMTIATSKPLTEMLDHYDAMDELFLNKYANVSDIYRTSAYLYYTKKTFPSFQSFRYLLQALKKPCVFIDSFCRKLKSRV